MCHKLHMYLEHSVNLLPYFTLHKIIKTYLSLFQIQTVLSEKPEVADFSKVADVLGTSREELESEC